MQRPLNTFSIVAREPETGHLGIAVSTKVPAVGSICPFVRFGVGAVSTQAWVNPYLGPRILDRLEAGENAASALEHEMAADPDRAIRQVGVVDVAGRAAAYTGINTDSWAGQLIGSGFSIQGNMLVGTDTLEAMSDTFTGTAGTPLAERLLLTLEAGQAAGGDKRGRQSAALRVHGPEIYPVADLRVDEHADPVAELRRVFLVAQKELFPFIEAMPTRDNPRGNFAAVRSEMTPKV